MDHRLRLAFSLLLLVTTLVHGSGQTEGEPTLLEVSTTSSDIRVTKATHFERVGPGEQLPDSQEDYHARKSSNPERQSREEGEEEYEGEDEDEYEEELKAVAESHEAMSKDEPMNSNVSSINETRTGITSERLPSVKSFDSHEVTVTNFSDEDIASNEAITDEVLDKIDQEECELLKYKKDKNPKLCRTDKEKTKRVPTVKKELSTQKEILIGSNETQLLESSKSLAPSQETVNRLGEEAKSLSRRSADEELLEKQKKNEESKLDEFVSEKSNEAIIQNMKNAVTKFGELCEKSGEDRRRWPDATYLLDRIEYICLHMSAYLTRVDTLNSRIEDTKKQIAVLKERINEKHRLATVSSGHDTTTISPEPATPPLQTTSTEFL